MRILALDPSTTACGWCIADDGEYVDSGVWRPLATLPWWRRLMHFEDWIDEKLGCIRPYRVITEIATGNRGNMSTNRKLGAVEFVVREFACEHEVPLITVTASQVRASGCHKKALAMASAIAGEEIANGDRADAIGVWLAGWKKIQEERLHEA